MGAHHLAKTGHQRRGPRTHGAGRGRRTRHVFVANLGSNTVSMLDAASGTLVAAIAVAPHHPRSNTVPVGQGEHGLAVHERTERVFVTNASDASVSLLMPKARAPAPAGILTRRAA